MTINRQWIKNLAQASYKDGAWTLKDEDNPLFIANLVVQEALPNLLAKIQEMIEVFNNIAPVEKQMKLYKLAQSPLIGTCGFMILIDRVQVKVEYENGQFKTEGLLLDGYQSTNYSMRRFIPQHDTFGEVIWKMDNKVSMSFERLAQQILEDTVRLAYETGVFAEKDTSDAAPPPKPKSLPFLSW